MSTDNVSFPNMQAARAAFAMIGWLARHRNGRRLQNLEAMYRWRLHQPEAGSRARTVPIAPRAARRARVKELRASLKQRTSSLTRKDLRAKLPFRPVYGHAIPVKEPHKEVIAAMKTMKKEIDTTLTS